MPSTHVDCGYCHPTFLEKKCSHKKKLSKIFVNKIIVITFRIV